MLIPSATSKGCRRFIGVFATIGLTAVIASAPEALPDGVDGRRAILIPEGVETLVAAGLMEDRFHPDEQAVFLYRGDDYQLLADGRISSRRQRLILIRTASALAEFESLLPPWDPAGQQLILHRCRTYLPDGEMLSGEIDPAGRILPVGLIAGSVLELDFELLDRQSRSPWLEGKIRWQHRHRALIQMLSVSYPSHLHLNAGSRGQTVDPVINREGERITHLWQVDNVPGRYEPDLTQMGSAPANQLIFSTCPSWEFLSSKVVAEFKDPLVSDSLLIAWSDQTLYTNRALTRSDRMMAVLEQLAPLAPVVPRHCSSGLVYKPLQPAAESFQTGSGTPWDQAALAMTLLNRASIRCWLALRADAPDPLREVPALCQFDQVLLKARAWPDTLFIDPLAAVILSRPADWGYRPLLMLNREAPAWQVYEIGPAGMDLEVAINLNLRGEVAAGTAELVLTGPLSDPEAMSDPRQFGRGYLAQLFPAVQLQNCRLLELGPDYSRLRITFTGPIGEWHNGRLYLDLAAGPAALSKQLAPLNLFLPRRREPLYLETDYSERVSWRIKLPENLRIAYLPSTAAITSNIGEFRLSTETLAADRIDLIWSLETGMREIPPARYEAFQNLLRAYHGESQKLVILTVCD